MCADFPNAIQFTYYHVGMGPSSKQVPVAPAIRPRPRYEGGVGAREAQGSSKGIGTGQARACRAPRVSEEVSPPVRGRRVERSIAADIQCGKRGSPPAVNQISPPPV